MVLRKNFLILKNPQFSQDIREILKGSLWSLGTRIFSLGIGYINTIILARLLGAEIIGVNSLTASIFAFAGLFANFGFPNVLVRYASQYEEDSVLSFIVSRIFFTSLIIAITISLFIAVFSDVISRRFFHITLLKDYLILYSLAFPFSIISNEMVETIRGLRKISVSESIRNSMSLINLFSILLLYYVFKIKDTLPAIAYDIIVFTVFFISFFSFLRIFHRRKVTKRSRIAFKEVIDTSLPLLITSSMMVIIANTDRVMLGYFSTPSEVGIYSIAFKLSLLASIGGVSINMILAPKISQLYWKKKIEELKQVVSFGSKLFFYTSFPVMVFFLIFPSFILSIFGKEFIAGKWVLIILAFSQLVNAASGPVGYFLMMTGKEKTYRNIVIFSAIVNVILNYLLIPGLGSIGAALGSCIATVLWNIVGLAYIWARFKMYIGYRPF